MFANVIFPLVVNLKLSREYALSDSLPLDSVLMHGRESCNILRHPGVRLTSTEATP